MYNLEDVDVLAIERALERSAVKSRKCSKCQRVTHGEANIDQNYAKCGKSGYQRYCRECQNGHRIKRLYGLTQQDFNVRLKAQSGRCAICSEVLQLREGLTAIDHCHTTGRVRGILCRGCNLGLGHFKDSTKSLHQAIRYLQQSR